MQEPTSFELTAELGIGPAVAGLVAPLQRGETRQAAGRVALAVQGPMSFELTAELGIGPAVAGRVVQRGEIR